MVPYSRQCPCVVQLESTTYWYTVLFELKRKQRTTIHSTFFSVTPIVGKAGRLVAGVHVDSCDTSFSTLIKGKPQHLFFHRSRVCIASTILEVFHRTQNNVESRQLPSGKNINTTPTPHISIFLKPLLVTVKKVRDSSGNVITEGFFYVGAEVTIHGHCFRVTEADDKTLRLMEERATEFPYSDPIRASEIVAGWVDGRTAEVREVLRCRDIQVCMVGVIDKTPRKRRERETESCGKVL